jgi:hypothetical protein
VYGAGYGTDLERVAKGEKGFGSSRLSCLFLLPTHVSSLGRWSGEAPYETAFNTDELTVEASKGECGRRVKVITRRAQAGPQRLRQIVQAVFRRARPKAYRPYHTADTCSGRGHPAARHRRIPESRMRHVRHQLATLRRLLEKPHVGQPVRSCSDARCSSRQGCAASASNLLASCPGA